MILVTFSLMPSVILFYFCMFLRPTERSGEDVDIILAWLKGVNAFKKFHFNLLQQICIYGFYEYLEKGVTGKFKSILYVAIHTTLLCIFRMKFIFCTIYIVML